MLYRQLGNTGDTVSILGYGCMRFPKKNGQVDQTLTDRQVRAAIERGVDYFDTAYIYPGSEAALGRILEGALRDKVRIATKLPLPMVHSQRDMESLLETQLRRLRTDRVDCYLMHCLVTAEGWLRLKRLGVEDFLAGARKAGKIRLVGFSYHGDQRQFAQIVDDYPWDFCQLQYNYVDQDNQAGRTGLRYAAAKGLGVVVMEPLRGGQLAGTMPRQVQAVWDRAATRRSPAEWALRWVWDHPEVSTVLSGMNDEQQVLENARIAAEALPGSLPAGETALVDEARAAFAGMMLVGCTGCGYCMPCPAGVNIPQCFSLYNHAHLFEDGTSRFNYVGFTAGVDGGAPSYASLCRDCGRCEQRCPQRLPVRERLAEVARDMEGFYFKPAVALIRAYYRLRGRRAARRVRPSS
jgi:uncharacterized protein